MNRENEYRTTLQLHFHKDDIFLDTSGKIRRVKGAIPIHENVMQLGASSSKIVEVIENNIDVESHESIISNESSQIFDVANCLPRNNSTKPASTNQMSVYSANVDTIDAFPSKCSCTQGSTSEMKT